MPSLHQLAAQLDRLATFDPGPFPVISLYLNTQPNQNGRDHFEPFLRKELAERVRTYPASGPERESLEQDADRIRRYVGDVQRSAKVLEKTIAALREKAAETDRDKVDDLLGAYRANGLAVVGVDKTRQALEMGEVDELIMTAEEGVADEFVAKARQTAAKVCFIEDPALLSTVGGVGARLRFKI